MGHNDRCIRVAMLNADTSIPNVYANMGTFGDILHRVLAEAAWRIDENLNISHSVFDVVQGEYPETTVDFDAVLITASAASSYQFKPWIQTLERYIIRVYREHQDVKIFGSCFGHHIVCQALLKDQGLRVEKSPKGWEIGVNPVALTEDFRKTYAASVTTNLMGDIIQFPGRLPSPDEAGTDMKYARFCNRGTTFETPETVRLQFVHEDQVVMPCRNTSLSEPWVLLGSTEHCNVQGVYQPGRVLTLQGHFEFDKFESRQTERIFGADGAPAAENTTARCEFDSEMIDETDDGHLVAELVVRFFCEASGQDGLRSFEQEEMLPTPRSSVEMF